MKRITFEELIIEMMPFSPELVEWCKSHPEFLKALKNVYAGKFISLGAIVTSHSPYYPKDEVIGIYTYDYQRKNPIFKQDFIINKGKQYKEFVLFTRHLSSKYVKDIEDFYKTYGKGEYYVNSHHVTFDQLPDEIKPRGQDAIALTNKLKGYPLLKPSQEVIEKLYLQIRAVKEGKWLITQRLQSS